MLDELAAVNCMRTYIWLFFPSNVSSFTSPSVLSVEQLNLTLHNEKDFYVERHCTFTNHSLTQREWLTINVFIIASPSRKKAKQLGYIKFR